MGGGTEGGTERLREVGRGGATEGGREGEGKKTAVHVRVRVARCQQEGLHKVL